MPTLQEALQQVHQFYQAGHLSQAEQICRQILQVVPDDFQTSWYLGSICQNTGRYAEAVVQYQHCLRLNPQVPEVWINLGNTQRSLRQFDEGIASYRQAMALNPNQSITYYNLANVLRDQGKHDEAVANYRQALQLQPNYVDAFHGLGAILAEKEQFDEAIVNYQQAIHLQPSFAPSHFGLGVALAAQKKWNEAVASYQRALQLQPNLVDAHRGLATAQTSLGRPKSAEASYRKVLEFQPNSAEALAGLAEAVAFQAKFEEAVTLYERAIQAQSDLPQAYSGLGAVQVSLGKLDEAIANIKRALELKPDSAKAYNCLGAALAAQGKLEEAEVQLHKAVEIQPEFAGAQMHIGIIHLLRGELEQGWRAYEHRTARTDIGMPSFTQPRWDGAPLDGRTILLFAEQGLGDTIQFIRYAPLVKSRGGRVVVTCHEPLVKLLSRCEGVDLVVEKSPTPPPFDVYAMMLSLPGIFQTSLESIPADVPYLFPDEALVTRWRSELESEKRLKVGIVWQGSPGHLGDRHRSFPLTRFAPLAEIEGVCLYSVQKGTGIEQLAALNGKFSVIDLGGKTSAEFDDTAAAIKCLDLVITPDTSVAHLSGALAVPVWVAMPFSPDWRWLLKREDSPWYPTMRLFRQTSVGDWDGVFERLAMALRQRVAEREA